LIQEGYFLKSHCTDLNARKQESQQDAACKTGSKIHRQDRANRAFCTRESMHYFYAVVKAHQFLVRFISFFGHEHTHCGGVKEHRVGHVLILHILRLVIFFSACMSGYKLPLAEDGERVNEKRKGYQELISRNLIMKLAGQPLAVLRQWKVLYPLMHAEKKITKRRNVKDEDMPNPVLFDPSTMGVFMTKERNEANEKRMRAFTTA